MRADLPAEAVLGLGEEDLGRIGTLPQEAGRGEPGDPAADDRDARGAGHAAVTSP
ncbi:hypothetical protein ACWED2_12515 [Amycolatopsis sp. NPDC005003]